jgi:hypothetical protein
MRKILLALALLVLGLGPVLADNPSDPDNGIGNDPGNSGHTGSSNQGGGPGNSGTGDQNGNGT